MNVRHLAGIGALWLSCLWGGCALAQEMITIPAGTFTMGRDDGPEDERPAHQVTLPAFQIDRLPVTNALLDRKSTRLNSSH